MTEQLDTADIRAMFSGAEEDGLWIYGLIVRLCDALDAARAERDDKTKDWYISNRAFRAQWDRAEAAEAERDQWRDDYEYELGQGIDTLARAEAAEARIAAAEENLTFAQQRAADNGLRAEIGEGKIRELVAEIRALKSPLPGYQTKDCNFAHGIEGECTGCR